MSQKDKEFYLERIKHYRNLSLTDPKIAAVMKENLGIIERIKKLENIT